MNLQNNLDKNNLDKNNLDKNNLDIYIVEKNTMGEEDLVKTKVTIEDKEYTVRSLLGELVKFEINRLEKSNKEFSVVDEAHLNKLVILGKVGGNLNLRKGVPINIDKQIEKAWMCFEHLDYYLFINDEEALELNQVLELPMNSEIIIVNNIRFH